MISKAIEALKHFGRGYKPRPASENWSWVIFHRSATVGAYFIRAYAIRPLPAITTMLSLLFGNDKNNGDLLKMK